MLELSTTERAVLAVTGRALFGAEIPIPRGVDWREVRKECNRQTVTILGFEGAKAAGAPKEVLNEWEKDVAGTVCNNLRVSWEHNELDELMQREKIPYVALKGCASAMYYPEPVARVMGDVDFLVERTDQERAGQALEREGFVPWDTGHICHVVYRRPPAHYELHFQPPGIPEGEPGRIVREYFADIMEQARTVDYENGQIACPSPFHHGLVILLHASHHFLGEGIGLRHLCDWAVFVSAFSDREFREVFEKKLRAVGLWKMAGIFTRAAEKWLGCPVGDLTGDLTGDLAGDLTGKVDEELADVVIAEIFESGNFGRKAEGRVYETYLISNRGKNGVGRTSMIRQLFQSVNSMVYTHWPVAKRIPILLPLGWMFFTGRYMLRIWRGKRPPLHLREVASNAAQRRKLYRKIHLFEME